jgi:hypothetical protein
MPTGFKVVGWLLFDADKDLIISYPTYIKIS